MKGFCRRPTSSGCADQTGGRGRTPADRVPRSPRRGQGSRAEILSTDGTRRRAPSISDPDRSASHGRGPRRRSPGPDHLRHRPSGGQDRDGIRLGPDPQRGPGPPWFRRARGGARDGPRDWSIASGRDRPRGPHDVEHALAGRADRNDRLQPRWERPRSRGSGRGPPSVAGGFGERPRPSDGVLPRSRPRIPRGHGAGGGRRDRDRQGDRVPRALHVIAFVTTNEGKYREVSAMLADAGVKIVREDRSYPEIQADRLEKVVRFAATVLDDQIRGDYLIDDSGLFLDAFGGFPGVYSSYVHKRLGNPGLLKLLQDAKIRAATFERSEERRVGKECTVLFRSRWSRYHEKKKERMTVDMIYGRDSYFDKLVGLSA